MPTRILAAPDTSERYRVARSRTTSSTVYITCLTVQSYADFEEDLKTELGLYVEPNEHEQDDQLA